MVTPVTWKVELTVPSGASANQPLVASVVTDPSTGAETSIRYGRPFLIKDVYVTSSQGVDGHLEFWKDDVRLLAKTPPVNALDISKTNRPKPFGEGVKGLYYRPNEKLTVKFVPYSSPSSDTTVTVYLAVEIY